jgi:predicted transcriptional regulator
MTIKKLGRVIRTRRKELGLSQNDLKDFSGVHNVTISLMENGKYNPSLSELEKIINPLGLEIILKIKDKNKR